MTNFRENNQDASFLLLQSPPRIFPQSQPTPTNLDEFNYQYNIPPQQQPANYAPTYENLLQGQLSAMNTDGIDPSKTF